MRDDQMLVPTVAANQAQGLACDINMSFVLRSDGIRESGPIRCHFALVLINNKSP